MTSGVTTAYVHIAHDPLCERTGTTYTDYVYVNGKAKEKLVGSNIYHYLSDPMIGSTWQVWKDGANSATSSVKCYKPFGTPYTPSGTEKVKYAGEIQDSSTGLYYIFARYMDPELGRFISLDPQLGKLSVPQSLDRYVYCVNNPLRFTDPTGEWFGISLKTIAIIAVCIAATVLIPGAGGIIAGVVISAVTQGAADAVTTYASTGSLSQAFRAGMMGAAEGAITGAIGGGIGKVASMGLKSIITGSAKSLLGGIGSKLGSSLRGVIGETSPALGARLEQGALGKSVAAGFRSLDDVAKSGMSTDLDQALGRMVKGEAFEMSLTKYTKSLPMTFMETQGYAYRGIVKSTDVIGSHLLTLTAIQSYST